MKLNLEQSLFSDRNRDMKQAILEQLEALTTTGHLSIAVSKLIKSKVFSGDDFNKSIQGEPQASFGGKVFFWAMVNMTDDDRLDEVDAVVKAITDYVHA